MTMMSVDVTSVSPAAAVGAPVPAFTPLPLVSMNHLSYVRMRVHLILTFCAVF